MKFKTGCGEIIEAIQFNGNFKDIEAFVGGDAEYRDKKLLVATPDGPLWVVNNGWIVKYKNERFSSYSPGFLDGVKRIS